MTQIDVELVLDRDLYPEKSPLFVPLSAYDVMTALISCVLLALQYFISDLGIQYRIWTVSLDWIWRKYQ